MTKRVDTPLRSDVILPVANGSFTLLHVSGCIGAFGACDVCRLFAPACDRIVKQRILVRQRPCFAKRCLQALDGFPRWLNLCDEN